MFIVKFWSNKIASESLRGTTLAELKTIKLKKTKKFNIEEIHYTSPQPPARSLWISNMEKF